MRRTGPRASAAPIAATTRAARFASARSSSVFQCVRCKPQAGLTAGTLFDNAKLPLTTWFLAIDLLSQATNGISAMNLKRQLEVSYNMAWMLKHKLMQTMRERDDTQPLLGIVEVDDAHFGRTDRSAGASAGVVPSARHPCW